MTSVWARLVAFGVVLLGTFGTAYAVGEKLPGHSHAGHTHTHTHGPAALVPPGFQSGAYQLVTDGITGGGGTPRTATFHLSENGANVTSFDEVHGALLHTVVIRPDLSGFQHVHPDIAADGTWDVTVDEPGAWHIVFEATPTGATTSVVVSANLDDEVPVATETLPAPDDDVTVDGIRVTRTGLTFTATMPDGSPVDGLEPYLGQAAHLVAIRQGDLAYVHLHPMTSPTGTFMFGTALPQAGTYRLFLQFGYRGDVVTVPFTVVQA